MLSAGLILFLAALQGLTELFPVSSLGHAVVVPPLLGINFQETDPAFVPVLTLLHLGTAGALIVLYRHDWARIVAGPNPSIIVNATTSRRRQSQCRCLTLARASLLGCQCDPLAMTGITLRESPPMVCRRGAFGRRARASLLESAAEGVERGQVAVAEVGLEGMLPALR